MFAVTTGKIPEILACQSFGQSANGFTDVARENCAEQCRDQYSTETPPQQLVAHALGKLGGKTAIGTHSQCDRADDQCNRKRCRGESRNNAQIDARSMPYAIIAVRD